VVRFLYSDKGAIINNNNPTPPVKERHAMFQGVRIHRAGVTPVQAKRILDFIKDAYYSYWNVTEKGRFTAKTTEINIKSGSTINQTGTVLDIGCNVDISDLSHYLARLVSTI